MRSQLKSLYNRQLKSCDHKAVNEAWSRHFFSKLNLETTLKCHGGCVNCLQWNKTGQYLLSGSDDSNVCLWEPLSRKLLATIPSHHEQNIFSVKFINQEKQVISGAGDGQVRHLDISSRNVISAWRCHRHRVKRCCTMEDEEHIALSSSEDGTVRQFDIREGHTCSSSDSGCSNVLVKLAQVSIKSINSNPTRTHLICVGASDEIARVYDRRMLSLAHGGETTTSPLQSYLPGHLLPTSDGDNDRMFSGPSITWTTFDPTGNFLLCNMGGEQIYLYDVEGKETVVNLQDSASDSEIRQSSSADCIVELDPHTTALKDQGNLLYNDNLYDRAVTVYSQCLARCPNSVILLNNRAQALLKRNWKGDAYAALRDSLAAIEIDPTNEKAHFRQIKSLHAMDFNRAACRKLMAFQARFSTSSNDRSFKSISDTVNSAIESGQKDPIVSRTELYTCTDYKHRYLGHCNFKTDIKEANFFGPNQEYIMAGSDDRYIFFWERMTGEVLRVYRGDNTLVNCLQPHPYLPLIASSGLEKVVKLWSPQSVDPDNFEDINDMLMTDDKAVLTKISSENQKVYNDGEAWSLLDFLIQPYI